MLDNIKFKVLERDLLENHIIDTRVIDLNTSVNIFNEEEPSCLLRGNYFNMEIVFSCLGAYMKGSLHMMTNLLKGNKRQNYNDFTFSSASESISHLKGVFGLEKTSLTNLELGLNISISKDPQDVLDYNILMYDYEGHNKDLKFRGKGDYKEFHKTDYYLKIYNKSKQYSLQGNILRLELKILSKRKLQNLGVYSLEDLQRKDVINRLYTFLWGELQKLTIIDDFTAIPMPPEDTNSLNEYTNPNYWKKLSKHCTYKVRKGRQRKFKALIVKYGLDTTQKEILKGVSEKYISMMDCEASHVNRLAA